MAQNGLTGFDPEQVRTSINKVINSYNDLMDQIGERMQKDFVNGMADKWACKQAQNFFESFKNTTDSLIAGANQTFESVVKSMNDSAIAWANSTDSSYSPVQFTIRQITMNISNIMENINGVRGIDLQSSDSVSSKLALIKNDASSSLQNAKNAVTDCGFVGGGQETNLIAALDSIRKNIDSAITNLTEQSKKAIDDTKATYGDVEGKVSQAFQGQ